MYHSENNFEILTYVINLDKDVKRLKEMESKLSPNKFTRVPGIYGNTDDMKKYENIFPSSHFLTPKTVLATGLSHKKAIETYLKDIEKSGGVAEGHDAEFLLYSEERPNPTVRAGAAYPKVRSKRGFTGGARRNIDNHSDASMYNIPTLSLRSLSEFSNTENTCINSKDNIIGLILEDDATPIRPEYMKEIETAVKNAPPDWEIIKLDYLPKFSFNTYNKIPTTLFTAYLINRKGALKYKNSVVCYHADIEVWFKDIIVYNNPTIVFEQIWNKQNGSNNQTVNWYNPLSNMSYITNYKVIRVFTNEYTIADLILFILVFISTLRLYTLYIHQYSYVMAFGHSSGFFNISTSSLRSLSAI